MSLRRVRVSFAVMALIVTPLAGWSQSTLKVSSAPLKSPWHAPKSAPAKGSYNCPVTAALPHDIVSADYYSDAKHSVIDPVRKAAYDKSQEVFRAQQNIAEDAADAYQKSGNAAAAACVIGILKSDVAADAMTGDMSSNQANYVQGWTLGALAVSYLKVRPGSGVSPADDAAIGAWMVKAGREVQDYFGKRHENPKYEDSRNNHFYWAGFTAMTAGIAGNDRPLFDWGISTYKYGVSLIQPDGTLPLEMNRGQRALHYHLFALGPLVMMAEFGEDNGVAMYVENHGAIHLLVNRSLAGLANNSYFAAKAGAKQDTPEGGKVKTDDVIWAVPYVKRFPNPSISALINSVEYRGWNYLGGLPPQ